MTRLMDLHNHFVKLGPNVGPDDMLYSPRFKFNSGFHDGTDAAEVGRPIPWDPRTHHDPVYVAGYFAGREAYGKLGHRPDTSQEAWDLQLNTSWRDRAHLFIVTTTGEPGELELIGSTASDRYMGQLLHYDEVPVEDRLGDGVVYARNQDGVMVELVLDMDEQTPIVREVEITPEGVVYLEPAPSAPGARP